MHLDLRRFFMQVSETIVDKSQEGFTKSGELLERAQKIMRAEAAAIALSADHLGPEFVDVLEQLEQIVGSKRKLLFSGVGKNVSIATKLVGTFNSIGVSAAYLDPTQAMHGDLGLCNPGDLCILISNSGRTSELLNLVPLLNALSVSTVSMTQFSAHNPLASLCKHGLYYRISREACPLQLVPTASTTACLALGDALAMTYAMKTDFRREDFARLHPGGNLGRGLTLKAEDLMRKGNAFATTQPETPLRDALKCITQSRSGLIAILEPESQKLLGIFTDGDLRRCLIKDADCLSKPIGVLMTPNPVRVQEGTLLIDLIKEFERFPVNALIVVNAQEQALGVIDLQDIPKQ